MDKTIEKKKTCENSALRFSQNDLKKKKGPVTIKTQDFKCGIGSRSDDTEDIEQRCGS